MDANRTRRICWNFINGYCSFGARCIYSHDLPDLPTHRICRYFQKGSCWYGDLCKYIHIILPEEDNERRGSEPAVSSSMVVPVPLSRRGSEPSHVQTELRARHGGTTETLHSTSEVYSGTPQTFESTHSSASSGVHEEPSSFERSKVEAGTSSQAGSSAAAAATFDAQSEDAVQNLFHLTKSIPCGICMDVVYEKPDPKTRVFGILPNCNHSFCLCCIKTWRKSKDFGPDVVKTCPQCRVSSPFYMPNKYWVEGSEKEKLLIVFKEKFGKKSCGYYARSGFCPFKKDCLYRHDIRGCSRPLLCLEDDDDEDSFSGAIVRLFIAMALLDGDDDELLNLE